MPNTSGLDWGVIGTAATVVLGILGIAITVVITIIVYRFSTRKSLGYTILTLETVLTVKEIAEDRIKVLFDGVPVKNITLAIIRVINNGKLPILASDYEKHLSFNVGPGAEIVSAEIIDKKPPSLTPNISIGVRDRQSAVDIEPLLLNGNDSITMKLLIKGTPNQLIPEAHIAGVTRIEQVTYENSKRTTEAILAIGQIAIISIAIGSYVLLKPTSSNLTPFFVIFLCSSILTIAYALITNVVRYRLRVQFGRDPYKR